MTAQRLHTVTGATNYTGMYIAQLLLQQGHRVQSITHHHPNWGSPFGDRVPLHPFNFDQPNLLRQTLEGTDTLFNTYWIRANHKDRTDQQYIEQTRVMFQAAREAGVRRIVHISITNPDPESDLPYFQGKGQLEDALRDLEGVSHAILRPTVIYSAEDMPLNIIAWTLRQFPVENKALFIIDGQHRRRAISQLLHDLRADLNRANDLEKTEAQQVLVTLYVCQHERDMKQLFAWMAKNKPIESNTQELFDSSDPWNNATQDIRDDTDLLKGRINLNKATLGRNDEYLLTNSLLSPNPPMDGVWEAC